MEVLRVAVGNVPRFRLAFVCLRLPASPSLSVRPVVDGLLGPGPPRRLLLPGSTSSRLPATFPGGRDRHPKVKSVSSPPAEVGRGSPKRPPPRASQSRTRLCGWCVVPGRE